MFAELKKNPYVEFTVTSPDSIWIRISGIVDFLNHLATKQKILDHDDFLKGIYGSADNPEYELIAVVDAKATFYSFTQPVSYTHLDMYKRQPSGWPIPPTPSAPGAKQPYSVRACFLSCLCSPCSFGRLITCKLSVKEKDNMRHCDYMKLALAEAREAYSLGEAPVGLSLIHI